MPAHHPHHHHHHSVRWLWNHEEPRTAADAAEAFRRIAGQLDEGELRSKGRAQAVPADIQLIYRLEKTPHGTTRMMLAVDWRESDDNGEGPDGFAEILG